MDKRILVTGGAGYIGSHTVAALQEQGYALVVVDNLYSGHRRFVPEEVPCCIGDLTDQQFLHTVFQRYQIEAVVHFAALSLVGESVQAPERYYWCNVGGTANLLRVMRTAEVKQIIFSSSAAVYGTPEQTPIPETHPCRPINPYGATKVVIEQLLADAQKAWGLGWTSLRYFNAAGAHPQRPIGEAHDPETHLIPNILAAAAQRKSWQLFGDDYPTPDGTCVRDYIHVCDLASAHIAALRHLTPGQGKIYNVGTGQGSSIREVWQMVQQVLDCDIPCKIAARRPGDPAVLVAQAHLIQQELEWRPRYSTLEMIVGTAWKWYQTWQTLRKTTEA